MGFIVYATASEKYHGYVKSLGATRVFDYRAENVVESIFHAARAEEEGVCMAYGFDAVGWGGGGGGSCR